MSLQTPHGDLNTAPVGYIFQCCSWPLLISNGSYMEFSWWQSWNGKPQHLQAPSVRIFKKPYKWVKMWGRKKAWDRFSRFNRTCIGLSVISHTPYYTSMSVCWGRLTPDQSAIYLCPQLLILLSEGCLDLSFGIEGRPAEIHWRENICR